MIKTKTLLSALACITVSGCVSGPPPKVDSKAKTATVIFTNRGTVGGVTLSLLGPKQCGFFDGGSGSKKLVHLKTFDPFGLAEKASTGTAEVPVGVQRFGTDIYTPWAMGAAVVSVHYMEFLMEVTEGSVYQIEHHASGNKTFIKAYKDGKPHFIMKDECN